MVTRKCQLCGSDALEPVIDLGHHPLADTFLPPEALDDKEKTYPLRVLLCECGYATLDVVVPAEERYQAMDYSYTASNSPVSVKHFSEMAKEMITRVGVTPDDLVVDVGSNDGTLLRAFRDQTGCRVLGVEPSGNIAAMAEQKGIPTLHEFFDSKAVEQIVSKGGAKAITATNVYNHITDLNAFMADISRALTNDGMFVFEAPSLLELVSRTAFDTVYLEHVSYFGIKPLARFYKKFGLHIHKIDLNDYMGGSMRVYVGKQPAAATIVENFVRQEKAAGIYAHATYVAFMARVRAFKSNLYRQIVEIKRRGGVIIAIGAATKGNTLLNYCNLNRTLLECVTDSSPLKIGKITPGSHLPIVADADIPKNATHALILPWNIGAFLKDKLKHLPLEFIVPHMGN